jgi:hypothetical protein
MKIRTIATSSAAALCVLSISLPLRADFTYTETTQITGGSLLGMMKMAGSFSRQAKQAGEPTTSTVMIKGNRMTRISPDHTEIIDLDKETVTQIDTAKHQYTVITFEQMKQRMDAAMAKAKAKQRQPQSTDADIKFQIHVRNTDATKEIAGLSANEAIMTMTMDATDKSSGQAGSMAITNDMWLAPEIPGYGEVRDFYARYALKMGRVFSGAGGMATAMLASHPGAEQGMQDLAKEVAKMKGIPVLQVMRMGTSTDGKPLPAASEAPLPASNGPATPTAGEVGQQTATSAIASGLGLGGFGGFGHKKKADPPPDSGQGQQANAGPMVLIESNTQLASFSQAPVDGSKFEVPAGFKQVEMKGFE